MTFVCAIQCVQTYNRVNTVEIVHCSSRVRQDHLRLRFDLSNFTHSDPESESNRGFHYRSPNGRRERNRAMINTCSDSLE